MDKDILLKKTPLYALSCELNARMSAFAGYHMPIQYATGIIQEHLHVRQKVGLFDISHMGQIRLVGSGVLAAMERLVPSAISSLSPYRQRYSVLTESSGGVLDDIMIMNLDQELRLVVNAACKQNDLLHLKQQLTELDSITLLERALIALQGPLAAKVLEQYIPNVSQMKFMDCGYYTWQDEPLLIARCGYTGEDGFEISIANDHVESFTRMILNHDDVEMVGLGARDSLRLEAGLCLYGQDLTTETTPLEAGLNGIVSKQRIDAGTAHYLGSHVIAQQLKNGTERLRVGLRPLSKAPLRAGTELLNSQDEIVGTISSGGFAASVKGPIAMAYVLTSESAIGSTLKSVVRGKTIEVEVCALPFIPHRYCK